MTALDPQGDTSTPSNHKHTLMMTLLGNFELRPDWPPGNLWQKRTYHQPLRSAGIPHRRSWRGTEPAGGAYGTGQWGETVGCQVLPAARTGTERDPPGRPSCTWPQDPAGSGHPPGSLAWHPTPPATNKQGSSSILRVLWCISQSHYILLTSGPSVVNTPKKGKIDQTTSYSDLIAVVTKDMLQIRVKTMILA